MSEENKKYSIGGSALMEGIMMIGPKGVGMSLRMPDGSIETQLKKQTMLKDKHKIARIPFIRGPINFVDQMIFTYKCMMESAEKTSMDIEDGGEENMSKVDKWLTDHFGPKMMTVIGVISAVLGFALAFLLFVWLPSLLADGLETLLKTDITKYKPLIEGVVRGILFVLYMLAVSYMKDIRRVFMYHGAEHKSIFCYEKGLPLTVDNVRAQTRFHPRCGTSFMFVMLILSILAVTILSLFVPAELKQNRVLWMLIKLPLIPIIMGIGYEFIRYAGRHDNLLVRILSAPGLWMQRITTKEPDDDIIECGIEAIKAVITENPEDDEIK